MAKSMTKAQLAAEIARRVGINKKPAAAVLNALAEIAYEEASNGFLIPGICKLKVVKRKASRCRNPATGQMLLIGERDVLKAVPVKKAKTTITPRPAGLVTTLEDEPPTPSVEPAAPAEQTQSAAEPLPENEEGQLVFTCPECGTTLAAPSDHAGTKCHCPVCDAEPIVPNRGEHSMQPPDMTESPSQDQEGPGVLQGFISFVCDACGQLIEAPTEMIGAGASCPTCGTPVSVPQSSQGPTQEDTSALPKPTAVQGPRRKPNMPAGVDRNSMTIRIDYSDLE